MEQALKNKLFYLLCVGFIGLNITAIVFDFVWLSLLPFALLFALLILFSLDTLLFILCFLVPLSINVDNIGGGLGLSLPDEPLVMLIMCLAIFKFIINSEYDYRVFRHPLTIVIILNMLWTLFTVFTSEHPFVSAKFFLSRLWFVVVFYFLGVVLFKKFSNIIRYLWLYLIPLTFAVLWTLYQHSAYNFEMKYSFEITRPFYVAHGVYGAAIAFFIPITLIFILFPERLHINKTAWFGAIGLLLILIVGLIYSYTRASWISIAAAVAALRPLLLRIKFNTILIVLFSAIMLFIVFQSEITYMMSKTDDKSSKDFSEHFRSISNINTDASNAERINRWVCAWKMFEERPVLGFGPGTYSFVYAPFQLSQYKTVISTNFGDGGNAHSEYLGPLCETGLPGLITILMMVYFSLATAFRLFYTAQKARVRYLALALLLAFITYFVHGLMNNYSETDKIAILWWGGFAMLTALDLYHNPQEAKSEKS
ncbi:MAG: O-antigen ligase family protein [Bacteroidota bacterium]